MLEKLKEKFNLFCEGFKEGWDECSSDGPSEPHEYVNNESEETNMFGTLDWDDYCHHDHDLYR